VFSVDGIHILVNVIIFDSIHVDLVLHVALFWGMVAMVAIQAKEGLY
jgi:hypothetical protein